MDGAILLARINLERHPEKPNRADTLGEVLFRAGRYDDAASAFEKALTIAPEWIRAHLFLGRIRKAQGAKEKARAHFRRVVDVAARGKQSGKLAGEARKELSSL